MSISRDGRAPFSFMRSIRLVPPAMNFASGSAAARRTASATSLARVYSKLFIRPPSGLLGGLAEHHLLDGGHDVGIGAATADIAAHQLADFSGRLRPALGDQTHSGTD